MLRVVLAASLALLAAPAIAADQGIPVQILVSTFACRDISDMVRLAMHHDDNEKDAFRELFMARQATGDCAPLRAGTIALLQDSHDEQGFHFDCIKQREDRECFWSAAARLRPAP